METTRLFTKGQTILPKTSDGVLLRPAGRFPETQLDQVAGCLQSNGKRKSLAQMRDAIARDVRRRHNRGRY